MEATLEWTSRRGAGRPDLVDKAEVLVGLKFPTSYKNIAYRLEEAFPVDRDSFRFLSKLTRQEAIYGVGRFIPFAGDQEGRVTFEWLWHHLPEGFPKNLVPFSREAGGNLICFDYRANVQSPDPPIVVWHQESAPGSEEEISFVASNFDEFCENLFDG